MAVTFALGAAVSFGAACGSRSREATGALRFRAEGDELVATSATYTARVAPAGSLVVAGLGLETVLENGRAPTPRLDEDGSIRLDRGVAIETLRATEAGIAQSWLFSDAARDRDLVVRVRVSGMQWETGTPSGHLFVDPRSDRRTRYGEAFWIDRRGAKTKLRVDHDADGLAIVVPRDVVAASELPAVLDPVIGPEMPFLDPGGTLASIASTQAATVTAGTEGSFLATWTDSRPGFARQGLAARVGATGAPQEVGIVLPLRDVVEAGFDPTSGSWVVAGGGDMRVQMTRVSAAGDVLDPTSLPLFATDGAPLRVGVTRDGGRFFVVATDQTSLRGVFTSPAGVVAGPAFTIGPSSFSSALAAACDAATCATLSSYGGGVRLTRIDKTGSVLGSVDLGTGEALGLATDGTQYLTAWVASGSLYTRRVSSAGEILGAAPLLVSTGSSASGSVVHAGSRFVVTWSDVAASPQVHAARVASDGTLETAPVALRSGREPSIAWDGARHLVTWSAGSSILAKVLQASRVGADLAVLDASPLVLSRGKSPQLSPKAAFNGSVYAVAWSTDSGTHVGRLSATGSFLGSTAVTSRPQDRIAVGTDGSGFLVVWRSNTTIHASRLSPSTGELLDTPPLVLNSTAPGDSVGATDTPSVAFDGQSWVVAWADQRHIAFSGVDIYAARVTPAGALLDPSGILVNAGPSHQREPAAASDGTTTLVVWSDAKSNEEQDLYGARLSRSGVLLDPTPTVIIEAGYAQRAPALAWSGDAYLLGWLDGRKRTSSVFSTRLGPDGKRITPELEVGLGDAFALSATGDGVTDVAAWTYTKESPVPTLRASWLRRATGEVLDPGGTKVTPEALGASEVALAPAGEGRVAAIYARYVVADGAVRLQLRFLESGANEGVACTSPTDCRTRHCSDAVCCDVACDGPCRNCGPDGKCAVVTGAPDPDTCAGALSCDSAGACKKAPGQVCARPDECASGFCADGFCCDKACDGACDVCNDQRGTCTIVATGSRGEPSCSPRACDGFSATCPMTCASDETCAPGFGCDRPTGTCVDGPVCIDRATARSPDGTRSDCLLFACRAGSCLTACRDVNDCTYPAACDENGRCVVVSSSSGAGCVVGAAPCSTSFEWLVAGSIVMTLARRRRRR